MSYNSQNAAVRSAILAFTAELKSQLAATAANAETASYAENSGKLEGLTLNEVVELIAGTTGLTIQDVQDALDAHIARQDNPHNVTAAQVGLDLVDNFATATEAEAAGIGYNYVAAEGQTAFTGADEDGTPLELQDTAVVYIEKNGNRIADVDYTVDVPTDTVTLTNPTSSDTYSYTASADQTVFTGADDASAVMALGAGQDVTVTQNGTALVAGTDYTVDAANNTVTLLAGALASDVIAITAADAIVIRVVTTDRFMTPRVLWHVMDAFWSQKVGSAPQTLDTIYELAEAINNNEGVIQSIEDAIANKADQADIDASIAAITKADIGLGNVENFGIATNQEAIDGLATDKYVTPALVKAHVDVVAQGLQSNIDGKASQADIDASIAALTKADIGLGSVENYGIATEVEAVGSDYTFTATAGQTAFSGSDDDAKAMSLRTPMDCRSRLTANLLRSPLTLPLTPSP